MHCVVNLKQSTLLLQYSNAILHVALPMTIDCIDYVTGIGNGSRASIETVYISCGTLHVALAGRSYKNSYPRKERRPLFHVLGETKQ